MLTDDQLKNMRRHYQWLAEENPSDIVVALDELAALRSFAYDCILDMRRCGTHARLVRIGIQLLGVKDLSADAYADAPRREHK